jgi:hypothetical protein
MESTLLNLLTRDGILTVEFEPELDTNRNHYVQLHKVVREAESSEADIRAALEIFAKNNGLAVRFL